MVCAWKLARGVSVRNLTVLVTLWCAAPAAVAVTR
jgi:hypothetical protein